jgi:hypothetical protein
MITPHISGRVAATLIFMKSGTTGVSRTGFGVSGGG